MTDTERIRTLLKEAEVYRKQGLLKQSQEKYVKALQVIEKNQQLANRTKLIDGVQDKIRTVERDMAEIDEAPMSSELDGSLQDLIKKRFSFSENKETAAFEGALALAKFGQYEQALEEFHKLLKEGIMPVVAAKNIITCFLTFATPDAAIAQFGQWISMESLSKAQLKQIRAFLKNILEKKGIKADLPRVEKAPPGREKEEEDAAIDLSSIIIQLEDGPLKGETVEFDVAFQSDNNISVIVEPDQKDLLHSFKTGARLAGMQCFSPIGFFRADGIILDKTKITDGPKQGDYMLEITIDAG